ncbi:hypothetical protein FOZ62_009860 [Perkinsus olseni]|uniref:Uncharacterized protein n=2 Tax=Perkinsus olseni TaxID=32597 RepID=A0A7J6QBL7_PEROL|nr:hypothetical protein FOZ62_009860 [Perkinsus olseni]
MPLCAAWGVRHLRRRSKPIAAVRTFAGYASRIFGCVACNLLANQLSLLVHRSRPLSSAPVHASPLMAEESADALFVGTLDRLTAEHPHTDDPRFAFQSNQWNNCELRFTQFCRCTRELGEDDPRCKYQYYRAQTVCHEFLLEDWMEHRHRGTCDLDIMPDRQVIHMRQ